MQRLNTDKSPVQILTADDLSHLFTNYLPLQPNFRKKNILSLQISGLLILYINISSLLLKIIPE
jgi:hypothetical protein